MVEAPLFAHKGLATHPPMDPKGIGYYTLA
jgi:hypothetical protein